MRSAGGRTSRNATAAAIGHRRVRRQCKRPGVTRRRSQLSVTQSVMVIRAVVPIVRIPTNCSLQGLPAGASSTTSRGLWTALMLPSSSSLVRAIYVSRASLAAQ
jgi:hypothetical protein